MKLFPFLYHRSRQISSNGFFRAKAGQKAGFRVMLKYLETKKAFRYYIKQIDSMLPCVCSVIDHRRRQNVVRTSVTHSAIASCATFLFLPHFDVICDLLLTRRTATWNLFVKSSPRFTELCMEPRRNLHNEKDGEDPGGTPLA